MDCNVIATGIVGAVRETGLKLPLVVRLEGNNVEAGKKTLAESGLTIISGGSKVGGAGKGGVGRFSRQIFFLVDQDGLLPNIRPFFFPPPCRPPAAGAGAV